MSVSFLADILTTIIDVSDASIPLVFFLVIVYELYMLFMTFGDDSLICYDENEIRRNYFEAYPVNSKASVAPVRYDRYCLRASEVRLVYDTLQEFRLRSVWSLRDGWVL